MKKNVDIGVREPIIHEVVVCLVIDVGVTELVVTDKEAEEFMSLIVSSGDEGSICITTYVDKGLRVLFMDMVNSIL